VRGYFTTVYAAGCLAFRYKILPFREPELLAAIMSCHRDHVAFVDAEVAGAPGWGMAAPDIQGAATGVSANDVPRPLSRASLGCGASSTTTTRAASSTSASQALPWLARRGARMRPSLGTSASMTVRKEYWILGPTFKRGAGGAAEDRALKVELFRRGLLITDRRGDRQSFVVKRHVPGKGRVYVVALRPRAEKR
jgi:hypothetical protein